MPSKHVTEGKIDGMIEVTARRGRRREQLLDDFKKEGILEIERGRTRSHSVENSLRKGLCTCKTDYYRMNATIFGVQTLDRETYFRATVGLFHGLFQDDFSN
jgi:hypothetical protein